MTPCPGGQGCRKLFRVGLVISFSFMKKFSLLIAFSAIFGINYLSAQITSPAPYCVADFDDMQGFPVADAVNSVSFGTLSNATNAQYAEPHYVFYNNLAVPDFAKGSTYTLSASFNALGGCGYGVWIDYNHDNAFDASEKVSGTLAGDCLPVGGACSITESVTIPTTALTGNTRMRIRIVEDDNYTMGASGYSISPCNASTSDTDVMDWGETEDYTINITGGTTGAEELAAQNQLAVFPSPATTSIQIGGISVSDQAYRICNLAGTEILSGNLNGQTSVDVSSLNDGIYLLQVISDESMQQVVFIKE